MKYKVVYLEWEDHAGSNQWIPENEIDLSAYKCQTIGYVIKEDKKIIVVAGTLGPEETTMSSARMYILKTCITKRRNIRL